jgi:hypothetical protein
MSAALDTRTSSGMGGLRIGFEEHPVAQYLRASYGLEGDKLHGVALFLLAHLFIDLNLIAAIVVDRVRVLGGVPPAELDELAASVANGGIRSAP